MKMLAVNSSNVKAIGWEDEILVVEFVKGGRYQYEGVPEEIYKAVAHADSIGKAFHRYIRPKQHLYKYRKIG